MGAPQGPHPRNPTGIRLPLPVGLERLAGRGRGCGGPLGTIWEDRTRPLSSTAMHRWWASCLERAGIAHRPMHEARHTAITDFLRRTGNIKLAQMLAGHADIGTTANIYAHLDTTDLESALRTLAEG
jgi:integrase